MKRTNIIWIHLSILNDFLSVVQILRNGSLIVNAISRTAKISKTQKHLYFYVLKKLSYFFKQLVIKYNAGNKAFVRDYFQRHMYPHLGLCEYSGVFGQQSSSMAHTKVYRALIHTQYLLVDIISVDLGFIDNKEIQCITRLYSQWCKIRAVVTFFVSLCSVRWQSKIKDPRGLLT